MRQIQLLLLLFLFSVQYLNAQSINWLNQHANITGDVEYFGITHDNNGNIYNVGSNRNSGLSSCSGKIILSSFSGTNVQNFSNSYTPSLNNNICDEKGNAVVYHNSSNTLIIGGQENGKAFLGFFNASNGAFNNKANITNTSAFSSIKGLCIVGNNIFAVGYFKNSITLNGSPSITLVGTSNYNVFVAKFDLSGNVLQASRISASPISYAIGYDIDVSSVGNIFISVAANGNLSFNGTGNYSVSGGHKTIVFKLNTSLNYQSGITVSNSPYVIQVDEEFPIEIDQNNNKLYVSGIHQTQQQSFLTKLDIIPSTPTVIYQHNLDRIVKDISLDCYNIYITGLKGSGSLNQLESLRQPCSISRFLFLDTHDLNTGAQSITKQASGCTIGQGIVVDDNDKIWVNGHFGEPMTFESLTQGSYYNKENGFIAKLTSDSTCIKESRYCCPGDNLVINGDFESGNTGFTNVFMFNSTVAPNSIIPGQYGVINGGQANTISPTWSSIQDPSTCSNSIGTFLVVNGENGGGSIPPTLSNSIPDTRVVWEQNFTVQDWRGYKFCFKAKNLDQCGFNIAPKLEVQFSMPFGNINQTVVASAGPCDWQDIIIPLDLWGYGTTLNIKIVLNQSLFGDGNDVAIDNVALILLDQCPLASAEFDLQTVTPHPTSGTHFSISATADIVPPCEAIWWEVCKFDPNTNDCISGTKLNGVWWSAITNFPGYIGTGTQSGTSAGLFEYGSYYRIIRGTWGDCHSWKSASKIISAPSPFRKVKVYSEKDFEKQKNNIIATFDREFKVRR
ncbi:MAG: hypothetical protein KA536_10255 [Saprospiraceae bacterium]|nr:hypothetical protein [Saprospiraceae bacterium]